jgi:CelD/BcsL family acetyltransferase involved in cellulose biosynthesis
MQSPANKLVNHSTGVVMGLAVGDKPESWWHAMTFSPLRIEEIDSPDKLNALRPEWQRLANAHGGDLPFTTWEWNVTWWAHFREHRWSVKDSLFLRALRTPEGELVAVAPLVLTERIARGPLRFRYLQFFGAGELTELRGLLCAPAYEARAYATLIHHLRACASCWDWMEWNGLCGPGEQAVAALPSVTFTRDVPTYLLRLTGTWEDFKASRSRNVKESVRKCYNSLKRDNYAFTFEVHRAREELRPALERLIALHAQRAELTDTIPHSNVFNSTAAHGFLFELCDRLAERDWVRVFELRIAGKVMATRIGFVLGKTLYLYYSGYDVKMRKYSIMTTTVCETIKYAIAEGLEIVNLSTGCDVSKTRWGPEEIVCRDAVQISPSPRARLAYFAYRKVRQALEKNQPVHKVARKLLARRSS